MLPIVTSKLAADLDDEDLVAVLLAPLGVMAGASDLVLDPALVVASLDPEVAALAPVGVPGVGDLPVLDAILDAPADKLDGVAASHLAGDVVVDAASVVLEVGVDREGSLDGATSHDHLLDLGLAAGGLDLSLEGVLVAGEAVVGSRGIGVTSGRALRGGLMGAARLTLGRVGVLALRTMVVAVRQGEIRAHALSERALPLYWPPVTAPDSWM